MKKVIFLKELQYSNKLSRIKTRLEFESEDDYNKRVKIAKYGLEGEERAYFQISNINLPLVCLSDLRIKNRYNNAQADFIVIAKDCIYLLEVKNLLGNIRVTGKGDVIRIIPQKHNYEEVAMANPFTQIRRQANIFEMFLSENEITLPLKTLIVMGNPRTRIYFEEKEYPVIRYDKLYEFFEANVLKECTSSEFDYMLAVGKLFKDNHHDRVLDDFMSINKKMNQPDLYQESLEGYDLLLYEELLEFRRYLSKELGWPLCNIFINRDAANLVRFKPNCKDSFMSIPGLKQKKYDLFGDEVIAIIKKYTKKQ